MVQCCEISPTSIPAMPFTLQVSEQPPGLLQVAVFCAVERCCFTCSMPWAPTTPEGLPKEPWEVLEHGSGIMFKEPDPDPFM